MKGKVYAVRRDGELVVVEILNKSPYKFSNASGPGSWSEVTGFSAVSEHYRVQFGSVQGTVRCTGCHSYLNLAAQWASEHLGTQAPSALSYDDEFKGHFNVVPRGIESRDEFNFECYAGEPCIHHVRPHYHRMTGLLMDPQPNPWPYLPAQYQKWYLENFGEFDPRDWN